MSQSNYPNLTAYAASATGGKNGIIKVHNILNIDSSITTTGDQTADSMSGGQIVFGNFTVPPPDVDSNTFYDNHINSTVNVLLNDMPSSVKSYHTLEYEGSKSKVDSEQPEKGWFVSAVQTDKEKGSIEVKKPLIKPGITKFQFWHPNYSGMQFDQLTRTEIPAEYINEVDIELNIIENNRLLFNIYKH